jgi:hypothetical protein
MTRRWTEAEIGSMQTGKSPSRAKLTKGHDGERNVSRLDIESIRRICEIDTTRKRRKEH